MFILKSKAQLTKAIEKAKNQRAKVHFIEFGKYAVKGTTGNLYTVVCRRENGNRIVECNCKAGTSEKSLVCWHSASALALHTAIVRQRQTIA